MRDPARTPRIFYGWYILAASFIVLFLSSVSNPLIGVMLKPMSAEFDWSRSATSSAVFLNMAVYALSIIITGRLYDRYGPKWVIAGSILLFSTGYALMATIQHLWQFLLYFGVISAAGLGGTTVPMFGSLIGRWFEKRRGLVISLALAGYCLGHFTLIPVFSEVINTSGWRVATLWIAGLCCGIGLLLTLAVLRGDPKDFGLQAYGLGAEIKAGAGMAAGAEMGVSAEIETGPRDLSLTEAMRTRSLWLFTVVMFICGGGDNLVTTHLVPMVTDYGISSSVAADMLAWLGLLSLPGILLAGPAADAIGNKLPIVVCFVLRVVLFVMLIAFKGSVPFWVFSLGFGLTLLVTAPLTATLVAALYGVGHIGLISGFITTVHMVGAGLWSYLGGVIFDRTGNYDLAFILMAILAAMAVVCTLFIREERHLPKVA